MKSFTQNALSLLLINACLSVSALANPITFDNADTTPLPNPDQVMEIEGFLFETNLYTAGLGYGHGVGNITQGSPNWGNGSKMFYLGAYANTSGDYFSTGDFYETITSIDGNPFSITSLQIGGFYNFGNNSQSLTLLGIRANTADLVSASFLIPASGVGTFANLTDFTNLVSLKIGGLQQGYVAIDNLNIQVSPVPLPGAALLMASALGLGGLVSRRRKAIA